MLQSHHRQITSNRVLFPLKELLPDSPAIITLDEAKAWLKMDGITDDDLVIQAIIDAGVLWVEAICAISIQQYQITATLEVHNRIELPYGIVTEIVSVNGVPFADVSECRFIGAPIGFPKLVGCGEFVVIYKTGYNPVPPNIKLALREYVAFCYEHRGDVYNETDPNFCRIARQQLSTYRRNIGV